MYRRVALITLLPLLGCAIPALLPAASRMTYPAAPRENITDDYHGVRVADPYRWLENPDAPRSQDWIAAENALTNSFLQSVPGQASLRSRLTQLWSAVSYPSGTTEGRAALANKGGRYFFMRRDGGKNQPILYWMASREAAPKPLLDPNALSSDGTAALLTWAISGDGKLLAYGIARSGSDWQTISFRDVDTGQDRPDKLEWSKFSSLEWRGDGQGIYYGRFPKPENEKALTGANYNQKIYFHKLATPQSDDQLVYERPDHKNWLFQPRVSDDGHYLFLYVGEGTRPENLVFYKDLLKPGSGVVELVNKFEGEYDLLGIRGSKFYFHTTFKAPKGRVISMNANRGDFTETVAQTDNVLDQAVLTGESLYLVYDKDVVSAAVKCDLKGSGKREIPLPGKGRALWAERLTESNEQFFSFIDFQQPETLYSLDVKNWRIAPFASSKLPFDPQSFETRQIFYKSKDGTRVPMFLVGQKGFKPDGNRPCLLWGYGGFNISNTPSYWPLYLKWIELGGILASANMRGGGEYGEEWHQAGMKGKKQNVFDDFIAAAEWLVANKYTSRGKLAIFGWSNGGLLIGSTLNQRPDLFGAAVAGAGVMDMLRFPKFTIGNAWTSEYGSPDNPAEFRIIRAYSPLHNIREGVRYPATLILTSDHDDRVVPAHSFKYAAELQHAQAGPAPILIRIETRAGHGSGKPLTKQVEDATVILAFLQKSLGMEMANGQDRALAGPPPNSTSRPSESKPSR